MKQLTQNVQLLSYLTEENALRILSTVLATPYAKGEYDLDKTKKLIEHCVNKGHESVLEHINLTLDCLTNVETYKDYTRHRHCAFTIESTSFVNYDELRVVLSQEPTISEEDALRIAEKVYREHKNTKVARDYLPQCTAARMIMTTNIREWRFILGLRSDTKDNPLTRELRALMFTELNKWSEFFFPMDGDCGVMEIKQQWK